LSPTGSRFIEQYKLGEAELFMIMTPTMMEQAKFQTKLCRDITIPHLISSKTEPNTNNVLTAVNDEIARLYALLARLRKREADNRGVPPWTILPESTLGLLARFRPLGTLIVHVSVFF
jgi:hypothetical protein